METEETKESIDQPQDEESQDQPEVESEESDNSEETDQPLEESEELDSEEREKGYLRMADYTRKTQEIAAMKRELEAMKASMNTPRAERTPEEQKALETLERLGVAKRDDVQAMINQAVARQRLLDQQAALKAETGLDDDVLNLAQLMAQQKQIPVKEAIDQLRKKLAGEGSKVVKRKSVGVKGGVSTSSTNKPSEKVKPLQDMSDEEFDAYKKSLGM